MKRLLIFLLIVTLFSCGKGTDELPATPENPVKPVDPELNPTIGFFLNNWQARSISFAQYNETNKPGAQATAPVLVDCSKIITKVPDGIFGINGVSYAGPFASEQPVMQHLFNLKPGIVRFPGGDMSNMYFFNLSFNQRPSDVPSTLLNSGNVASSAWYWSGSGNPADKTDLSNYYALLQQNGGEGMLTINYGYARYGLSADPVAKAAKLAADWVRYDNGRTKYWVIGNEPYGRWSAGYNINTSTNADGQPKYLNGQLYGQHVKVFIDSMKKAASEIGKTIYIGATLAENEASPSTLPNWNNDVVNQLKNSKIDFYDVHTYYVIAANASYEEIINYPTLRTGQIMKNLKTSITSNGGTLKPIGLSEYGSGSNGGYRKVSFVAGMQNTLVLGEAIKNGYGQALRWALAEQWNDGNDYGLFNKGDESDGVSKWNPRPAFYYMYYFKKLFGDRMVSANSTKEGIIAYASTFTNGKKGVVIVNKLRTAEIASINISNASIGARYYWYTLTGGTDNGDFSRKVFVNNESSAEASGGPADKYTTLPPNSALTGNSIKIDMPARSVAFVVID